MNTEPINWTLPAAEILQLLLEDVWIPVDVGVTIAAVETALAAMPGAADLVLATFTAAQQPTAATVEAIAKAGRMQSAFIAMSSEKGLLLSTADRQEMVDLLAVGGGWPDAVRDAVKSLGGVWMGRWKSEGFATEPSLTQVQSRQSLLTTRTKWAAVQGVVEDRLHTGAITTWQEVVEIVEEV